MSDDELTRLRLENNALRDLLEAAESQIHGEWGVGPREPYDWLPEMEQHICGQKTGHRPTKQQERRWTYNGRDYHRLDTKCALCDAWIASVDIDEVASS